MIAINIEMPKTCGECPIPYITDNFELDCPFQEFYVTELAELGERAEDCPLEELEGENIINEINIVDRYVPSKCDNCKNNSDELSGECYECVKGIEDWYEPIVKKTN